MALNLTNEFCDLSKLRIQINFSITIYINISILLVFTKAWEMVIYTSTKSECKTSTAVSTSNNFKPVLKFAISTSLKYSNIILLELSAYLFYIYKMLNYILGHLQTLSSYYYITYFSMTCMAVADLLGSSSPKKRVENRPIAWRSEDKSRRRQCSRGHSCSAEILSLRLPFCSTMFDWRVR